MSEFNKHKSLFIISIQHPQNCNKIFNVDATGSRSGDTHLLLVNAHFFGDRVDQTNNGVQFDICNRSVVFLVPVVNSEKANYVPVKNGMTFYSTYKFILEYYSISFVER